MEQTVAHTPQTSVQNRYAGSCHCRSVRFLVRLDLKAGGSRCNCSVCSKTAQLSGMTKPADFELLSGEASLSTYEWGGRTGRRFFCKQCGIHCFGCGYLAELGGEYVSVNLNCLDGVELSELNVIYWDGRHDNWRSGPRATPWPMFHSRE